MMKSLRQIIFAIAVVIGLALSASAQKNDPKPRPPKDPKVIKPGDKPPRDNRPKGGDKPQKPGMSFYLISVKPENDNA